MLSHVKFNFSNVKSSTVFHINGFEHWKICALVFALEMYNAWLFNAYQVQQFHDAKFVLLVLLDTPLDELQISFIWWTILMCHRDNTKWCMVCWTCKVSTYFIFLLKTHCFIVYCFDKCNSLYHWWMENEVKNFR